MELPFSYQTPDFIQELTKVTFPGPPSNRIARNGGKIANKPTAVSRNAARERTRVKSLRTAFQNLQRSLPYVPPNTKLSKLDVLILATTYISHLMKILNDQEPTAVDAEYPVFASCHSKGIRSKLWETSYLHPVKKWPMRSRLYAGVQEDPMNLSMEAYNHPFPTEVGKKRRGLSL